MRILSFLALAPIALGVAVAFQATVWANHTDYTHNNPEAVYTPLTSYDLPRQVVRNTYPVEYLVTSNTDALDSATDWSVANWNNGLRNNSPTNLTKDVFKKNPGYDDPAANLKVVGFEAVEFATHCGSSANHGCPQSDLDPNNDLWDPNGLTQYVIINLTYVSSSEAHKRDDIAHELGHMLFFNEHFGGTTANCPPGIGYSLDYCSVMDFWECDGLEGPALHDRQDFLAIYRPQTFLTRRPCPSTARAA